MLVDEATRRFRADSAEIERRTTGLVSSVWSRLDLSDVAGVREAMIETVEIASASFGEASSLLAAEYYDESRAMAEAPGRYSASVVPDIDAEKIRSDIGWAVDPLNVDDPATAFGKAVTVALTMLTSVSANTIRANVASDPAAQGWYRIARANGCQFCVMLSQRGAVYKRETVDFAAHGNCHCTAKPSWDPNAREVDIRAYEASERTDKLRALDALDGGDRYERHKDRLKSWLEAESDSLAAFRSELL